MVASKTVPLGTLVKVKFFIRHDRRAEITKTKFFILICGFSGELVLD